MSAATTDEPVVVTEPGVYEMSNVEYHLDPVPGGSLSSTGARKLLPPLCPAIFDYERRNPPAPSKAFDLGNAAHDTLLGGGPEIVVCDYADWRSRKSQDEAKEHRERGAVPLLPHEWQVIVDMVASVRAHPIAGPLLDVDNGQPEASLFWTDDRTGVNRRARLDLLPAQTGRRLIVPDLKTCKSAQRDEFAKSAASYGYNQQAPYYLDGVRALDLGDDPVFVFVAVEKTPPYLVNVIQLDVIAMRIGEGLNRQAIDVYAQCSETGVWPGYSEEVELASLPVWYERAHEQDLIA